MEDGKANSRNRHERRTKPRFRNPPAKCNVGRVVDLSAGGLRLKLSIHRRLSPGDTLAVVFEGTEVLTRVAWIKRNLGGRTVGVSFETITPGLRQMLSTIAISAVSVPMMKIASDHPAKTRNFRPAGL